MHVNEYKVCSQELNVEQGEWGRGIIYDMAATVRYLETQQKVERKTMFESS